jgi:hypothetical protein
LSAREIDIARQSAQEALNEYARLAFGWNAPDDEHTRRSIRVMAERAITTHDPAASSASPEGEACSPVFSETTP